MLLVTDLQGRLRALDWVDSEVRMQRLLQLHYGQHGLVLTSGAAPKSIHGCLDAYWSGDLSALNAVPVKTGGTSFQQSVWAFLRTIPAGHTRSYQEQARAIGRGSAVRAVAGANGANPVGIVIPCHRVIGSGGSLTGYAGGIERKRWLLRHEGGNF
ncbi:MAG: methylated-DNA--[protein]-cysteine S-methyltransferase [Acidithiobacillus sp.]